MKIRRALPTAVLAFASAAVLLSGCQDSTRVTGSITLANDLSAPDTARHTLYVAAFKSSDFNGSVWNTAATPVFVEFGGVTNDDFNPDVTWALGGAGAAEEVGVVAWWKINDSEQLAYEPPAPGDLFGVYPQNPIFRGQDGSGSGSRADNVDFALDGVWGQATIHPPF